MSGVPPLGSHVSPFWAVYQSTWHPSTPPQSVMLTAQRECYFYLPQAALRIHDLAAQMPARSQEHQPVFGVVVGPNGQVVGTGLQFVGQNGMAQAFWIVRVWGAGLGTTERPSVEAVTSALREGMAATRAGMKGPFDALLREMGQEGIGEQQEVGAQQPGGDFGPGTSVCVLQGPNHPSPAISQPISTNDGFGDATAATFGRGNTPLASFIGPQQGATASEASSGHNSGFSFLHTLDQQNPPQPGHGLTGTPPGPDPQPIPGAFGIPRPDCSHNNTGGLGTGEERAKGPAGPGIRLIKPATGARRPPGLRGFA